MRAWLSLTLCALAVMVWAVPETGAAHFHASQIAADVARAQKYGAMPRPSRLRVERERGLLLDAWINGRGPFVFAVDTGAGLNVMTARAAAEAQASIKNVRPTEIAGLSNARVSSSREAVIDQLAVGQRSNTLPSTQTALVVPNLPDGIDGILDPVKAYAPYGFSIDMPNRRIEASNAAGSSFDSQREGATVSWVRLRNDNRPFIKLRDGRIALVDTGSGFGLAVNGRDAVVVGGRGATSSPQGVRDIGGGTITSRRVAPTTVSIGELVLRRVPTDILYGLDNDVPVILGRDALYPFKITFDPRKRLIEFVAASTDD